MLFFLIFFDSRADAEQGRAVAMPLVDTLGFSSLQTWAAGLGMWQCWRNQEFFHPNFFTGERTMFLPVLLCGTVIA